MSKLFDKMVMWTDSHLGLKNNSKQHNEDCLEFIIWMIAESKKEGIETCSFLGDFFHNRSTVNIETLNYGLKIMKLINDNFKHTYWISGNHDMFFRHSRDVTSTSIVDQFDNITFINEITTIDDCTFFPFLVNDEWKTINNHKNTYAFGHFELPSFMLNSLIEMPDRGEMTGEDLHYEHVFSGHFHNRQTKTTSIGTKIHYIGNCFPHSFSDAWDDNRGICILEHGGKPKFRSWDNAPKYRSFNMSDLLKHPDFYLDNKTFAKVTIDCDLSIEEITYIKETYTEFYKLRDFNLIPYKPSSTDEDLNDNISGVETVDQIVEYQINQVESNTLDKNLLLDIYRNIGN